MGWCTNWCSSLSPPQVSGTLDEAGDPRLWFRVAVRGGLDSGGLPALVRRTHGSRASLAREVNFREHPPLPGASVNKAALGSPARTATTQKYCVTLGKLPPVRGGFEGPGLRKLLNLLSVGLHHKYIALVVACPGA